MPSLALQPYGVGSKLAATNFPRTGHRRFVRGPQPQVERLRGAFELDRQLHSVRVAHHASADRVLAAGLARQEPSRGASLVVDFDVEFTAPTAVGVHRPAAAEISSQHAVVIIGVRSVGVRLFRELGS